MQQTYIHTYTYCVFQLAKYSSQQNIPANKASAPVLHLFPTIFRSFYFYFLGRGWLFHLCFSCDFVCLSFELLLYSYIVVTLAGYSFYRTPMCVYAISLGTHCADFTGRVCSSCCCCCSAYKQVRGRKEIYTAGLAYRRVARIPR